MLNTFGPDFDSLKRNAEEACAEESRCIADEKMGEQMALGCPDCGAKAGQPCAEDCCQVMGECIECGAPWPLGTSKCPECGFGGYDA
jgi:hypothetical protein